MTRQDASESSSPFYFDVNVRLGLAQRRNRDIPWRTPDVARELARCGVRAALCHAPLAAVDDPIVANSAIRTETAPYPHLLPAAAVTPSLLDQIPPERDQWERIREQDMRAVTAWPSSHKVGLDPRIWQKWAGLLAEHMTPVLVSVTELPGPERFGAVIEWLNLFAPVPVVLLNASWGASNFVLRLMEQCPNLHMEMSAWQAHHCPEFLVRTFGVERVLFGSGQPDKTPGAARAAIDYADLPPEEKAAIAGGNLCRLLRLDALPSGPHDAPADDLAAAAREGRPLPIFVADAHAHVMNPRQHLVLGICFPDCTPDEQMALNRRLGIDIQCQASWTGPVSAAARIGNDILLASWRRFPEQVVPMATVDPSQMTEDEIRSEIRRLYIDGPAVGLKPYHTMGIPYHDPAWTPFFDFGNRRRLFALLHPLGNLAWTPESPQAAGIVDLARRHPELSILIAHCGSSFAYARTAVWIARQAPNVFLELTYTAVTTGLIEWLVREIGADRILFGTDAPMRDPRPQLGWIVHAAIGEQEKRRILGINFCRILARCRAENPAVRRAREALADASGE